MKAPAFGYLRARSLEEALEALGEHQDEARVIAGGQSLVPALNLRLLAPSLLVDIGGLTELRRIEVADGTVSIGALTRHVDIERSEEIRRHAPLLGEAIRHVAHPAIRNRGTFGGSVANADPASELPACCLTLRATMVVRGGAGERRIAADDFFTGIYETALKPDEILVRVEVPADTAFHRIAFHELARRSGDYAIVGLAARAELDGSACKEIRLGWFGIGDRPSLSPEAAALLAGITPDDPAVDRAAAALSEDLQPQDDLQASAAMRLHLARVLLRRAAADLFPDTVSARRQEAIA